MLHLLKNCQKTLIKHQTEFNKILMSKLLQNVIRCKQKNSKEKQFLFMGAHELINASSYFEGLNATFEPST